MLKARGRPVSGRKEELVARLTSAVGGADKIEVERKAMEKGVLEATDASNGPHWVLIKGTPLEEDTSVAEGFHAPTNHGDQSTAEKKKDFVESTRLSIQN